MSLHPIFPHKVKEEDYVKKLLNTLVLKLFQPLTLFMYFLNTQRITLIPPKTNLNSNPWITVCMHSHKTALILRSATRALGYRGGAQAIIQNLGTTAGAEPGICSREVLPEHLLYWTKLVGAQTPPVAPWHFCFSFSWGFDSPSRHCLHSSF